MWRVTTRYFRWNLEVTGRKKKQKSMLLVPILQLCKPNILVKNLEQKYS
jgi:hypothetical protein